MGSIAGAGAGIILRSNDGGDTGSVQQSGFSQALYSVSFSDDRIGTVVGDN
ncbi:MAG: hypothetical protein IPP94_17475 [Ignavibacteria bacterium]|nr:hypothetical protein [Ignavibacteria bacterium]